MTRSELIAQLLQLPDELRELEAQLANAVMLKAQQQDALADRQAYLIIAGALKGKNETERAAQLRLATKPEREFLRTRESQVSAWECGVQATRDRFSALKAVARLLGPEAGTPERREEGG